MGDEVLQERLLGAWIGLNGMLKSTRLTARLTYNEAIVMKIVYDQYQEDGVGRTPMARIVQKTNMLKSLMNRTVTALCAKGYLRRVRGVEDGRKLYVYPVEGRLSDFLAVHQHSLKLAQDIIAVVGAEDAARFVSMYEKLSASGLKL